MGSSAVLNGVGGELQVAIWDENLELIGTSGQASDPNETLTALRTCEETIPLVWLVSRQNEELWTREDQW